MVWLGLQPHQRPDQVAAVLAAQGILVSAADVFCTESYRPAPSGSPSAHHRWPSSGPLHRLRDALDSIPP
jgi:hypothetical protein